MFEVPMFLKVQFSGKWLISSGPFLSETHEGSEKMACGFFSSGQEGV